MKVHKPLGDNYVINANTLGEKLRNSRIEKSLLQKDLAEILGADECSIYLWEQGKAFPRVCYYPKIVEFLGYCPFIVDLSTIAGRIRNYRYRRGLSTKQFSYLVGVDSSTIRDWENLERCPSKKKENVIKKKLANILEF